MDDTELLMMIKADPETGVSQLMDSYMGLVVSVVRGRLSSIGSKEDIEDCVSGVFAEFYRGIDAFSPEKGTVKALLCSIAKHRASTAYFRKLRSAGDIPIEDAADEPADASPSAEELAVAAERRKALIAAIDALGEPDRSVIIRKYYLRESSTSIAKRLSMTVSAVDTRSHRALRKLRKALEGKIDE